MGLSFRQGQLSTHYTASDEQQEGLQLTYEGTAQRAGQAVECGQHVTSRSIAAYWISR